MFLTVKQKICAVLAFIILLSAPISTSAFIPINAPSAILIDQNTGNILFAHNEHTIMYPAGLTKMLTAIIALEYLDPQQVIVVGPEIYNVPAGALRSGHQSGEHITVHNLLRGLMIQNGNDSGVVLALQTVQAERNNNNVPFSSAMQIFSYMMNERAQSFGARNTHFVNPNGLHHDDHITSAYDLALIARKFMSIPILADIAAEPEFIGNSLYGYLGDMSYFYDARTIDHHWTDTNQLLSGGTFHYVYAQGIRSGSTPQSGDALAASAYRRGVRLIAIVLDSQDPDRWQDARMLFEYGFTSYLYHDIVEEGQLIETVVVANAKLGGQSLLDVVAADGFNALFSEGQLVRLTRSVIFDIDLIAHDEEHENEYDNTILIAPIMEGDILGRIVYTLDGNQLFETDLIATYTINERSLDSDMDFYIALIMDNVFSLRAFPFWMGGLGLIVGVAGTYLAVAERRRSRRAWYTNGKR